MPGSRQKRPCLNAAHDHHPRRPFVTHPPSRVSTWSRQLALRGRVVDSGETSLQLQQHGCAPVLKTDRDHPLRLVRYSARAARGITVPESVSGHQIVQNFTVVQSSTEVEP
jgi:hypothetical protein